MQKRILIKEEEHYQLSPRMKEMAEILLDAELQEEVYKEEMDELEKKKKPPESPSKFNPQ